MRTSPEVNRYMAEILKKMEENPVKMREKDIAISLYGLQSHEEPNRFPTMHTYTCVYLPA